MKFLLRLYGSLFYDCIIQIAIWFCVTFIYIYFLDKQNNFPTYFLQLILWLSSGIYFISSWMNGGQTLGMKAWRLKLVIFKNKSIYFYFLRYILATLGTFFLISFFWPIFVKENRYLHDVILDSSIIDVQT